MKRQKLDLMILAGVALLSAAALAADAKERSGGTGSFGTDGISFSQSTSERNDYTSNAGSYDPAPRIGKSTTRQKKAAAPRKLTVLKKAAGPKDVELSAAEEFEQKAPAKKPSLRAILGWTKLAIGAVGIVLAIALLFMVILMRKDLRVLNNGIDENARKTDNQGKAFEDAVRKLIAGSNREKNPILKDYDDLRRQNDDLRSQINELGGELRSCQAELEASRGKCAAVEQEVTRLNGALADMTGKRDELQREFDGRTAELEAERKTTESQRGTIAKLRKLIGENIMEMAPEVDEGNHRERSLILALAKLSAMHDSEMDSRSLLREFQMFDSQLNALFRDQAELQGIREQIKPFVERQLNGEYRISWPRIGANISEYDQNEELDLDESESGTTIKVVKSASIRFADADAAVFQKAKVICD